MSPRPRKQHFVPQFLLRNFAFAKESKLHAFNKHTSEQLVVSVRDAAEQNGFYDFQLDDGEISLEPALADLETATAPVIARIVESRNLSCLTGEDRTILALFLCVQFARSRNWRLVQEDLNRLILEKAKRIADRSGRELPPEIASPNVDDTLACMSIVDAQEHLPYILRKPWVLQQVAGDRTLYVSDSPLTLHNANNFGPYGNLGLAVPGVDICFPISDSLNLWIVCPTHAVEFEKGYNSALNLQQNFGQASPQIERALRLGQALFEGTPIPLSEENVEHYNSRQVRFSEQFVYSKDGNFELVQRMIADNPSYRSGLRAQI